MSPAADADGAVALASTLALAPEHLDDLRRSALTDETIAAAGIRSLAPGEWEPVLGPRVAGSITSAMLIPYPDADGFARVKLFPPVRTAAGGTMRYHQPPGSPPRLYFAPRARATLADPTAPLFIVEGEKKTLAGDQAGRTCLGLGGLWNWCADGRPIPDLDRVDWVGRAVVVVPDSDVWTRPDLLQPVYALGRELEARGATVAVLKLPAGPDSAKQGLDDFLCARSAEDLDALLRLPLKHRAFTRTAEWWRGWRAKNANDGAAADAVALLERGENVRTLHPAQDVVDGVLWYGVPSGDALVLVTSAREAHDGRALPPGLALRHTALRESSVSRDAALAWHAGTTGSVAATLDALDAFVRGLVAFPDPRTPALLAAWTLGTWCYRAFRVFPYLSIRSPEKACGKTRLLSVLRLVCFNAGPVSAVPTEAFLFRDAEECGGTQLLDEMEGLRGNRERFDALIAVLNAGFEHGGTVSRVERTGRDGFAPRRFDVYAPRALAGIAGLKDTLASRSIPVFMTRKRRDEHVARLTAAEPGAAALRDRCALACLARFVAILGAATKAPALLEAEDVDDRAVDLFAPLVALAVAADVEDGGARMPVLLDLARETGGLRDADQADGQTAGLVEALTAIRGGRGEELAPEDLRAALAGRPGWNWVTSTRRLAGLLTPLGFYRAREAGGRGARRRWVYRLDADRLADLGARYGSGEAGETPA